jgi:hypothetical protein
MDEETEGEVIGIEAQEGKGSPYILMLTHKSSTNCFRLDFSTGLGREWSNLGLKGLLSKSRKPPKSLICNEPEHPGWATIHERTLLFSLCGTYCNIPNIQLSYATNSF